MPEGCCCEVDTQATGREVVQRLAELNFPGLLEVELFAGQPDRLVPMFCLWRGTVFDVHGGGGKEDIGPPIVFVADDVSRNELRDSQVDRERVQRVLAQFLQTP